MRAVHLSRFLIAIVATTLAVHPAGAAVPRVVASIKPVHAVAAAIMEGAGAPGLLLKGANSPHAYAMRPSDAQLLSNADIVFWIGPDMETFLEHPLSNLRATVIALESAPGIVRLKARDGGLWTKDEHEGHEAHGAGAIDGHIWFDPRNGAAMGRAMAKALAASDAPNAALYARNAEAFAKRMAALDAELSRRFAPVKTQPFLVFHDAYHYLDARYGLNPAGAVTVAADRPVGARRIGAIRARLKESGALCVFSPPQFPPPLLASLTANTGARIIPLDDLGAGLEAGPGLYETLLSQAADRMVSCLAQAPSKNP
jgi:zinc transport system substrate-binding protein